jgi:cytochrome c oxidase cbb3-type subunit III
VDKTDYGTMINEPTPSGAPAVRSSLHRVLEPGGWRGVAAIVAVLILVGTFWAYQQIRRERLETLLLVTPATEVTQDPALVRFAAEQAKPLFAAHCAGCHGADMKGNRSIGTPNLVDSVWLYGDGSVFDIERTILFGIRSGHAKAHDISDMTAFGQRGMLSDSEIRNAVQFVLQLSRQPHLAEAAAEGAKLFNGKGRCFDCHANDARGNSDYGAPDLTANVWSYGGDAQSLYRSLYFGRHGICPAWLGPLDLVQIRALAVYIHSVSHS